LISYKPINRCNQEVNLLFLYAADFPNLVYDEGLQLDTILTDLNVQKSNGQVLATVMQPER
jgi:hypothetical protein